MTTTQVQHTIPRTVDATPLVLPTPSDAAGWTAEVVARLAGVDLPAHSLAHPKPVHDCPWCPPAVGAAPVRSSETYWREVAA